MSISGNISIDPRIAELQEKYPEFIKFYPVYTTNLDLLTMEEKLLIHRIIVGCTKLICLLPSSSSRKTDTKSKASNILATQLCYHNFYPDKFRHSDIRKKLPYALQDIKPSSLSKILRDLSVNFLFIKKTDSSHNRPGRKPSDLLYSKITGPEIYYEDTDYMKKLKQVIINPTAKKAIFFGLCQSQIIQLYILKTWLRILNQYNVNRLKKRDIFKIAKYNTIQELDRLDIKSIDKPNSFYDQFYITGGLIFEKLFLSNS